ncbi:MAG: hypothetical protein OEX22_00345 [Cyclobacteriaceae bacterium]|nr:hypothetical protein [Cyclobacteriaceae bacterium]
MLENLHEKERLFAEELISDSFSMASTSLGQILQDTTIQVKNLDFMIDKVNGEHVYSNKKGKGVHVIKTEFNGELRGLCHLIFSEIEVKTVHNTCLPEDILKDDNLKSKKMKWAILVEVANMVSSAVLNKFSYSFDTHIQGKVPTLKVISNEMVNEYIDNEANEFSNPIVFKAIFYSPTLNLSLDFIWLLDDTFISKIKEIAQYRIEEKRCA